MLSLLLLAWGCSSGEAGDSETAGDDATPGDLELDGGAQPDGGAACRSDCLRPEPERASEATLTPDGGTLAVTTSAGAEMRLRLPPGALRESVSIRMTPLRSAAGREMGDGLLAAVLFEPEGLLFAEQGMLEVRVDEWPRRVRAGHMPHDGSRLTRHPVSLQDDVATLPVWHFSGAAVGDLADFDAPRTPEERAMEALAVASEQSDPDAVRAALRAWFDEEVEPLLRAAGDDVEQAERAARKYVAFVQAVMLSLGPGELEDIETRAAELAAEVFRNAIAEENAACLEQHDHTLGLRALQWQTEAQLRGLSGHEGLDRETVIDGLCFRVEATIEAPETIEVDEEVELTLQAAVVFEDGARTTEPELRAKIGSGGTGRVEPDEALLQDGTLAITAALVDDIDQLRVTATVELVEQVDLFDRTIAISDGLYALTLGIGSDPATALSSAEVQTGGSAELVIQLRKGRASATASTVALAASGAAGTLSDGQVTIGSDGLARSRFDAGSETGSATVTATHVADGQTGRQSVSITIVDEATCPPADQDGAIIGTPDELMGCAGEPCICWQPQGGMMMCCYADTCPGPCPL
jgi:hypothetical protein